MRNAPHTRFVSEANRPRNVQAYETSIDLGNLVLTFTTFILSGPRVVCSSSLLGPTRLSHFPLFLHLRRPPTVPPRRLTGEGSPGFSYGSACSPSSVTASQEGRARSRAGSSVPPPPSPILELILPSQGAVYLLPPGDPSLGDSRCGQVWCFRHALQSSGSGLTLSYLTQPDDELVPLR